MRKIKDDLTRLLVNGHYHWIIKYPEDPNGSRTMIQTCKRGLKTLKIK